MWLHQCVCTFLTPPPATLPRNLHPNLQNSVEAGGRGLKKEHRKTQLCVILHPSPSRLPPRPKERERERDIHVSLNRRLETHTLRCANRYSVSLSCPLRKRPNAAVCCAPIIITPSLLIQIRTVGGREGDGRKGRGGLRR